MRLLDLYCGEGLAGWGYWRSQRFSEIVGVDLNPNMRTRYAFDFICGDALALDYDFLLQFDFIHASPPCQAYSKATPEQYRANHMRLIAATHLMLYATGKPYVIENVGGSTQELKPNLVMDGHSVGLPMERQRYFYVSLLPKPLRLLKSGETIYLHGGDFLPRSEMVRAMGLNMISPHRLKLITRNGIKQGIPPLFTQRIAEMVLPDKYRVG